MKHINNCTNRIAYLFLSYFIQKPRMKPNPFNCLIKSKNKVLT